MFCHKCGSQIGEGEVFCHKCGTKLVLVDLTKPAVISKANKEEKANTQPESEQSDIDHKSFQAKQSGKSVSEIEPEGYSDSGIEHKPEGFGGQQGGNRPNGKRYPVGDDFRAYLNDSVRHETGFQSAEELLERGGHNGFLLVCFGIPILLAIIITMNASIRSIFLFLILLIPAVAFGCLLVMLVTIFKSNKYTKIVVRPDCGINIDGLIGFLNTHLKYLPQFSNEWGYYKTTWSGTGIGGFAAAGLLNQISDKEIKIGSKYGKGSCIVEIYFEPDKQGTNPEAMLYYFRIEKGLMFQSSTLEKAVPILQGAIKYYLNNCQI